VARVNSLARAYEAAHAPGGETTLGKLRQLILIAKGQGFDGVALLTPGLAEKTVRELCWNVSSFLTDKEVETILG
jgi:hypothetical protein